jgi:hypothetical protein
MQVYQLETALQQLACNRPSGSHRVENVVVIHYGEIFKVREVAFATEDNAEFLGLKPGQMYLVIN